MKRRFLCLTISAAVLGLSVGCLYPDHGDRRGEGPDQRHDREHEDRHDKDHDREHGERHEGLSQPGLAQ
jgi:hypothetical protein